MTPSTPLKDVRRVSGGEDEHGHLEEFRTDPIALMQPVASPAAGTAKFHGGPARSM